MKVQIRADSVHIEGYVNAVDRFSRPMTDSSGRCFIEKIVPGTFARALNSGADVEVKHNHRRTLTSIAKAGGTLKEDNIGLKCSVDIFDSEVVERARKKELVGWSFGFVPLDFSDVESERYGVDYERSITDLVLSEVSIIDSRAVPCYQATSLEVRGVEAQAENEVFRAEISDAEYEDEADGTPSVAKGDSSREGSQTPSVSEADKEPDFTVARARVELARRG